MWCHGLILDVLYTRQVPNLLEFERRQFDELVKRLNLEVS